MLASNYPRVIAVGEGNGDLLRVTLLLPEECRIKRNIPISKQVIMQICQNPTQNTNQKNTIAYYLQNGKESQGPLATALASVQVDFNAVEFPENSDTFQNDGVTGRDRKSNHDLSLLNDILIGLY